MTGDPSEPVEGEGPVLLFDGVCNLCNGVVQFIIRHDPEGTVSFAPLQSETGRRLLERTGRTDPDLDSVILVEGSDSYVKSTAALRVARYLEQPYALLWLLRFVPRVIRDAGYDIVADHRYDWFGRREECMVPTPDVRGRFLEMTGVEE
jgi:predicted DCC family thiol-disulfide oxidoreductase YuxK